MASPVIGLVLFWMAVFVVLLVVNLRTKAPLTSTAQEIRLADSAPLSATSFTDSGGNLWQLTNITGFLQYIWTAPGENPRVLWDSQNFACGPNEASNAAYQVAFPTGPTYLQADSIVLGITPQSTDDNGNIVSFRLVMYAGDVRIESVTDNGFWSIFPQVTTIPLVSWPASGTAILWQSLNQSFNVAAQFLANGDLVTKQVDQVSTFWSASLRQTPAPCL